MFETLWNAPLVRDARMAWARWRFARCVETEAAEEFLELLLRLMSVALVVDPDLRRRVVGFEGRYAFRSVDGKLALGAHIRDGLLLVREGTIENPNASIVFRDGRALMQSLLSPRPDLLGSLLRQDVVFDGNLNYIYRLAFLARHLQLSVMGQA